MLETNKISEIARQAATANLASKSVQSVHTEPATDSEGREALRVTIVIKSDALRKLKGDAVLDTLVDIQHNLREAGEERFPIVDYITEDELEQRVGLKS
jgi:hypothetical protein